MIEFRNEVLVGDALERLRDLPAGSIHCVVTSPPYWALRDYGTEGQLGLEPTPELYVEAMVDIFREIWRVLRSDGTVWLNIGDTYAGSGKGPSNNPKASGHGKASDGSRNAGQFANGQAPTKWIGVPIGVKAKDLVGIPWTLALALRAAGWYLRRDVIWSKPNPMPESVDDRPTSSHEYVFMLTKAERYFYDAEAVKEPNASSPSGLRKMREQRDRIGGKAKTLIDPYNKASSATNIGQKRGVGSPNGRRRRSVWEIATEPNREEHFAAFPRALVKVCIAASSSERGACAKCGAPWARVIEKIATGKTRPRAKAGLGLKHSRETRGILAEITGEFQEGVQTRTIGWRPTCDDFDDFYRALPRAKRPETRRRQDLTGSWWSRARSRPGLDSWPVERSIVLDPFFGIGTTGLVALTMFRDFVGIELNPKYARIAERRLAPRKLQGSLF